MAILASASPEKTPEIVGLLNNLASTIHEIYNRAKYLEKRLYPVSNSKPKPPENDTMKPGASAETYHVAHRIREMTVLADQTLAMITNAIDDLLI